MNEITLGCTASYESTKAAVWTCMMPFKWSRFRCPLPPTPGVLVGIQYRSPTLLAGPEVETVCDMQHCHMIPLPGTKRCHFHYRWVECWISGCEGQTPVPPFCSRHSTEFSVWQFERGDLRFSFDRIRSWLLARNGWSAKGQQLQYEYLFHQAEGWDVKPNTGYEALPEVLIPMGAVLQFDVYNNTKQPVTQHLFLEGQYQEPYGRSI